MRLKGLILLFIISGYLPNGIAQEQTVLFTLNIDNLQHNKSEIKKGDKELVKAKNRLLQEAEKIIKKDISYTVTSKKELPPSGDIHDFYSMARYWWPNPKTKDGLPFIRKDGKPYPGRKNAPDSDMLSNLGEDTYILGLAYFFTGKEIYAKQVKKMIDVFFLNKKTKMNPNFEYAQSIKGNGVSDGSIVSANPLLKVIESIQLTKGSKYWDKQSQHFIKDWFTHYLDWMLNSKIGKKQRKATNNVGTYYTIQAATFALFTGQKQLSKKIIIEDAPKRIADQIDGNGAMQKELKRASSWSYVKYNLDAFRLLVEVALKADIDLWNYSAPNRGSIKKAYEWLKPYASGEKIWKYDKSNISPQEFSKYIRSSGFFSENKDYQSDKAVFYLKKLENIY